jgi:superfamily II DNA or RNA helicase
MKLRKEVLQGIERFLRLVPAQTRKRGQAYQAQGAVLELECLVPDQEYAAVVRGGEDYEVTLEFADRVWMSDCSCPMVYECKHAVAAMVELQKQATAEVALPSGDRKPAPAAKPAKVKPSHPQPPRSPVCDRLAAHLGRPLSQTEADFIRRVQSLYATANYRQLNESDLSQVCLSRTFYNWQPLELWPDHPRDDHEFWLWIALELRRRNARWPEFMDGITDFSLIEARREDWEREKEIARWHDWFRDFQGHSGTATEHGPLELRLVLHPAEARLQWRAQPDAPFADLKQAQAKKFAELFEQGTLNLAPESLPLWSAAFKPWHYESWWSFKYDSPTARPALNRLLRLPLPPERVVYADDQPLPRLPEPLQLHLHPPENGDDNYQLALTCADGAPPPPILCSLSGRPTLYLTERGLFTGPAADALDNDLHKTIPARALETANGLRFLHATGLPLPAHIAERVHTVAVGVTLSCDLKPIYPGSPSEDIVLTVTARAPGLKPERFTPQGWQAQGTAGEKPKAAKGIIALHDRAAQSHFPRVLETLGAKWSGYPGEWRLRLTKKTPEVFVPWLKSLPAEVEVLLDPELATLRDAPVSGTVSLDIAESGVDWFDLKVALMVGDTTLTPEELKLLLNARGGYVRLGKKGWRRLQFNLTPEEDEQLARLGLNARDFSAEPQRFHALQLADAAAKKFLAPERVERIQRRVSELKARVSPVLPAAIRAEMRPYQMDGYHFLAYLTANRFGGVLADDMGLGKTLQTLAWLAWLRDGSGTGVLRDDVERGVHAASAPDAKAGNENPGAAPVTESKRAEACAPRPSLVVCPKSVMDNWRAEAERFYPKLRVRLWRGESARELGAARENADLLVLNYAQLRSLSPDIANVPWLAAILDEAQYIKNPDSQTAQAARALQAGHRLALTGTPIENRLLDLWSIFGFAMPGALGNRSHFLRRFDAKDDPLARRRLAARVRPFLLRRTKAQVAKDLPDRVEEDLFCEMEGEQKTLYSAELKRARQLILGLKSNKQLNDQRFNVLTSLLRLRQICCHPALVDGQLRSAESAKVGALLDLLEPLMEEGHKVLVFSQFVTMLDLIRETVKPRQWPHFYLAGDTENRGELVQAFQSASGGAVFLISLKAGGFGLNLTAASYVVLFDPWWNPAVENQAIDRTHRIGQTRTVMAYRLLISDSIEQKIRALQKQKAALMEDVLGEERFAQSLTLEDLRFLFSE